MMLKYPGLLWLFLVFIPLIAWYVWKHRNSNPSIGISTTESLAKLLSLIHI